MSVLITLLCALDLVLSIWRERQRDRQIDRQTDRQTETDRDTHRGRITTVQACPGLKKLLFQM